MTQDKKASGRDEQNRLIAEWLYGPPKPCLAWPCGEWFHPGNLPDFFTSEEANALVLEKMRRPLLVSDWPECEGWRVDVGVERLPFDRDYPFASGGTPIGPTDLDRKTAVCLAALALIEKQ